jgi:restriction endonuclease Mrr
MSSTEEPVREDLNVKEVCEIITTGATNNLLSLKWKGLELTFKESHTPRKEIQEDYAIEAHSQGPEKEPTMSPEVLQKIEQDMKQAELEQMLINDPAQFEELLSTGEIEDEEDR